MQTKGIGLIQSQALSKGSGDLIKGVGDLINFISDSTLQVAKAEHDKSKRCFQELHRLLSNTNQILTLEEFKKDSVCSTDILNVLQSEFY